MNFQHYISYHFTHPDYNIQEAETTNEQHSQFSIAPSRTTSQYHLLSSLLSQYVDYSHNFFNHLHPDIIFILLLHFKFSLEPLLHHFNQKSFLTIAKEYKFYSWASQQRLNPRKFDEFYNDYLYNHMIFGSHPVLTPTTIQSTTTITPAHLRSTTTQQDILNLGTDISSTTQSTQLTTLPQTSPIDITDEVMCSICCDSFPPYTPYEKQQLLLFLQQTQIDSNQQHKSLSDLVCKYIYAPCQHIGCLSCWYQHIMTAVAQGKLLITCLDDKCESSLPRSFIQYVLYMTTKCKLLPIIENDIQHTPNQQQQQQQSNQQQQSANSNLGLMQPFTLMNCHKIDLYSIDIGDIASISLLDVTSDTPTTSSSPFNPTIQQEQIFDLRGEYNELYPSFDTKNDKLYTKLVTVYDSLFFTSYLHAKSTVHDTSIDTTSTQSNLFNQGQSLYLRCKHPCQSIQTDIPSIQRIITPSTTTTTSTTTTSQQQQQQLHQPSNITCHTCLTTTCLLCQQPFHAPLPCLFVNIWEEYMIANKGNQLWLLNNTRKCPHCRISIEKNMGCSHITCVCGYEFCWVCNGDWKTHIELNKDRPMNAYKCTSQQTTFQHNLNMNTNAIKSTMIESNQQQDAEPTLTTSITIDQNDENNNNNTKNDNESKQSKKSNTAGIANNALGLVWNVLNFRYLTNRYFSSSFQYIPKLYDITRSLYIAQNNIQGIDLLLLLTVLKLSHYYQLLTNFNILQFFIHKPSDFVLYLKTYMKNRQQERLEVLSALKATNQQQQAQNLSTMSTVVEFDKKVNILAQRQELDKKLYTQLHTIYQSLIEAENNLDSIQTRLQELLNDDNNDDNEQQHSNNDHGDNNQHRVQIQGNFHRKLIETQRHQEKCKSQLQTLQHNIINPIILYQFDDFRSLVSDLEAQLDIYLSYMNPINSSGFSHDSKSSSSTTTTTTTSTSTIKSQQHLSSIEKQRQSFPIILQLLLKCDRKFKILSTWSSPAFADLQL